MGGFIRFLQWAASFRRAGQAAAAVEAGKDATALGGFFSRLRGAFKRMRPNSTAEAEQRFAEGAQEFTSIWSKLGQRMRGAGKPAKGRNLILYDEAVNMSRAPHKWREYTGAAVGVGAIIDLVYEIYKHLDAEDIQRLADFVSSAVTYATEKSPQTSSLTSSEPEKIEAYILGMEKATEIPKTALLSGLLVAGQSLAPTKAFKEIEKGEVRTEFYNSVVNYLTSITVDVSDTSKAVTANAILEIFTNATKSAEKAFKEGLVNLAQSQKSLVELVKKEGGKEKSARQANMLYRYSFGILGSRHDVSEADRVEYELVDGNWVLKPKEEKASKPEAGTTTTTEAAGGAGSQAPSKETQESNSPAGVCGVVDVSKLSYDEAVKLAKDFNLFCLKTGKSPRDMVELIVNINKFSKYCEKDLDAIVTIIHQRI